MKVKVGERIHDADEEPVMVILSDKDKENIRNMGSECTKYCGFPEGTDEEEIRRFMDAD